MKHGAHNRFWQAYRALPKDIRSKANKQYRLLRSDPFHPSLHFKLVNLKKGLWSARVDLSYRAIAIRKEECFIWIWIGKHSVYDRLIK